MTDTIKKIVLFKHRQVRRALYNKEWWFVINDVIEVLTDSNDPAQYFKKLKERDNELAELADKGGVQFVPPLILPMETAGGNIAGGARKKLEKRLGHSIVTNKNYLTIKEDKKRPPLLQDGVVANAKYKIIAPPLS